MKIFTACPFKLCGHKAVDSFVSEPILAAGSPLKPFRSALCLVNFRWTPNLPVPFTHRLNMLLLGGQLYRNLNRGGVSSPSDGMGHALSPSLREASLCHAKGLISLQPVLPMCPPPSWPGKQDVICIRVSLELGVAPGLVFRQYSRGWSREHVQRGNRCASPSSGSRHGSVLLGRWLWASGSIWNTKLGFVSFCLFWVSLKTVARTIFSPRL